MNNIRYFSLVLILLISIVSSACSTRTRTIAAAGIVGGAVGSAVGYTFVHHGREKQYQTRNTIISGIVVSLLTMGLLSWHYRELQNREVEISGRYSRYRLCESSENPILERSFDSNCSSYSEPQSIGKHSVLLDENTRWVLPLFRRKLQPARSFEEKAIESYFVWEVVKPGYFVKRDRYPEYFLDLENQESRPQPFEGDKPPEDFQMEDL